MDLPLRERLGWKTSIDAGTTGPGSRAAMARAAFWLSTAGVLLALLALAPPQGPELDPTAMLVVAAGSALLAALAFAGFDRIPVWGFHAGVVCASALATLGIYAWGDHAPYGPLPYLWVTIFAYYFFSLPAALVHTAVIGAMFGVELGLRDLDWTPIDSWLATIGTLTVAGMVVAVIRDRLTGLISNLTDAARSDPLTGLLNRRGFDETFEV